MSVYLKDTVLTFKWYINPTNEAPVKADFDIILKKPDGSQTITNDGITTFLAPTSTAQGLVTYDLTVDQIGRWQVSLTIGTNLVFVLQAYREVYVVVAPATPVARTTRGAIMNTYGVSPEASTNLPVETPVYGYQGPAIQQYWDFELDNTDLETKSSTSGWWWKADGLTWFGYKSGILTSFPCSVPFILDNRAVAGQVNSSLMTDAPTFIIDVEISPDGMHLMVLDYNAATLRVYDFGTAWDPTTLPTTATNSYDFDAMDGIGSAQLLHAKFSPSGLKLHATESTGAQDTLYQYTASSAFDASTLSKDATTAGESAELVTAFGAGKGNWWNFYWKTARIVVQYGGGGWIPLTTAADYDVASLTPGTVVAVTSLAGPGITEWDPIWGASDFPQHLQLTPNYLFGLWDANATGGGHSTVGMLGLLT